MKAIQRLAIAIIVCSVVLTSAPAQAGRQRIIITYPAGVTYGSAAGVAPAGGGLLFPWLAQIGLNMAQQFFPQFQQQQPNATDVLQAVLDALKAARDDSNIDNNSETSQVLTTTRVVTENEGITTLKATLDRIDQDLGISTAPAPEPTPITPDPGAPARPDRVRPRSFPVHP